MEVFAGGDFSGPVILVQERANPSSDYYLSPRLQGRPVRVFGHAQALPAAAEAGAGLVFVRYVPRAWQGWVSRQRGRLAGLAFFMDDDLFDLSAAAGTPWRYRLKLARLAAWRQSWLRRMGAGLWVSTPYLAEKYAPWRPTLLTPMPLAAPAGPEPVVVFYHGSASHRAEIEWLAPIMAEVLSRSAGVAFEIIGDVRVNRLYKSLPRVQVVHPLSWENYRSLCRRGPRHIGLAPLLPGHFNAARSHVKFFDIQACGAAGIYSAAAPFAGFVRDGEDGLLVGNDPAAWVEAILRLAEDPGLRQAVAAAADRRVAALRDTLIMGV